MASAHREWRNAPVRSTGEAPEDSGNPTDGGCLATPVAGKKKVLRGLWGKSELTVREAGKLVVAKPTIHLSLLSPCILL
ncbi:hypothetical protein RXP19_30125, partial [Pseudomonas aeruginosa]|nr:hypothetical protein [Pseudomonas aeruginosa]MEB5109212.1 hypothetical protein [Pseudomonas aeruginosa]MEB5161589.1 hypothetical protein [Pseudomonas aeruginosa]MEB5173494.1 hypothetical protein [Pseudomonas aeruginosa]